MTDSLPALLARLETNGRTWDQMRRDSKEAAAVIRGLMQQNAELATHAKGLIDALNELASIPQNASIQVGVPDAPTA